MADEDYIFMCEHCAMPFSYFAQYKSHGVNCDLAPSTSGENFTPTSNIDYNCSYCKGRFDDFEQFLRHFSAKKCLDTQKTRLGSNDVCICVLCGFSSKRLNLMDHLRLEHENLLNKRQNHQQYSKFCPMCRNRDDKNASKILARFSSAVDFLYHLSTFHPAAIFLTKRRKEEEGKTNCQDKLVLCQLCDMYFLDHEMEQHKADLHPGNGEIERNFPQISTRKRRNRDLEVEDGEKMVKKRFSPQKTSKIASNRRSLLSTVLGQQAPLLQYRLSLTRRQLAEKEVIRSILRENERKNVKLAQAPLPIFRCSFCGAEFKSSITLNAHREIIHSLGVDLKSMRPDFPSSAFRWMLCYFYKQLADGKSSNLLQFAHRCRINLNTTSSTLRMVDWRRRQFSSFKPIEDFRVRQRVNGRPAAVEFPREPIERRCSGQINTQQHSATTTLQAPPIETVKTTTTLETLPSTTTTLQAPPVKTTTALGTPPVNTTTTLVTPPTSTGKIVVSPPTTATNQNGARLVILKRPPTAGSSSSSNATSAMKIAGITIRQSPSKFRNVLSPQPQPQPLTLGDVKKFLSKPSTKISVTSASTPPNRSILNPASSTNGENHAIYSRNDNGKIILHLPKPKIVVENGAPTKKIDIHTIE